MSTSRKRQISTAPAADADRSFSAQETSPRPGFSKKGRFTYTIVKIEPPSANNQLSDPNDYRKTAQNISQKHGNIYAHCLFEGSLVTYMLYTVSAFYENLEQHSFSAITLPELETMRIDVHDFRKGGLHVSWLEERLDEIREAKLCVERIPFMEEELNKSNNSIQMLEKEFNVHQQESHAVRNKLGLEMVKRAASVRTFFEDNVKSLQFSWKSCIGTSCSSLSACVAAEMVGTIVKKEHESAAQVILTNQGDIVVNCLFEGRLRRRLLESACAIYKRMENLSLKDISLAQLESFQVEVRDLEIAKVDVSWISKGLNDMLIMKEEVGDAYLKREEMSQISILKLESEMKLSKVKVREISERVEAEKVRAASLEKDIRDAKEKVSRFSGKSLVDGI